LNHTQHLKRSTFVVLLVLFCLKAVVIGENLNRLFYEARQALSTEEYEEALAIYRDIVKKHPHEIPGEVAQFWMGEAYLVSESFSNALRNFEIFLRKFPHSSLRKGATYKRALCRAYLARENKDLDKEILEYEEILRKYYTERPVREDALYKILEITMRKVNRLPPKGTSFVPVAGLGGGKNVTRLYQAYLQDSASSWHLKFRTHLLMSRFYFKKIRDKDAALVELGKAFRYIEDLEADRNAFFELARIHKEIENHPLAKKILLSLLEDRGTVREQRRVMEELVPLLSTETNILSEIFLRYRDFPIQSPDILLEFLDKFLHFGKVRQAKQVLSAFKLRWGGESLFYFEALFRIGLFYHEKGNRILSEQYFSYILKNSTEGALVAKVRKVISQ